MDDWLKDLSASCGGAILAVSLCGLVYIASTGLIPPISLDSLVAVVGYLGSLGLLRCLRPSTPARIGE